MRSHQHICTTSAVLSELTTVARRHGVVDPVECPNLAALQPPCDCKESHLADTLKLYVSGTDLPAWFNDGFKVDGKRAGQARKVLLFGGGSVDDRRNFIIHTIFGIEQDDKDAPNYRRGWDAGTFRRRKQGTLMWPLANYLAKLIIEGDEPDEAAAA